MIRPQLQSISGGGEGAPLHRKGDCFRTAIAVALAVPVPAIPHFASWVDMGEEHWWDAVQDWLVEHYGVELVFFAPAEAGWTEHQWGLRGFWLASVPSLNLPPRPDGPQRHMVVMHGQELAHDPSTGKRYDAVQLSDVFAAEYFRLVVPARAA